MIRTLGEGCCHAQFPGAKGASRTISRNCTTCQGQISSDRIVAGEPTCRSQEEQPSARGRWSAKPPQGETGGHKRRPNEDADGWALCHELQSQVRPNGNTRRAEEEGDDAHRGHSSQPATATATTATAGIALKPTLPDGVTGAMGFPFVEPLGDPPKGADMDNMGPPSPADKPNTWPTDDLE